MAVNWTELALGGVGTIDQLDRTDKLGAYIEEELGALSATTQENMKFQPFTVAGYGGGAAANATGGVNYNMDAAATEQANMLQGGANQMFQSAMGDVAGREGDIYERMRAMQRPEEQRSMTDLESRAFAQGRLGMSADNYGGSSPEMLAMADSINRNKNAASVAAIEQARMQQAQDASIGGQFQAASYMPQAQLQNMFNQGLQTSQLQQASQLGAASMGAQLGLGQIQSQVNAEKIRAELLGGLFNQVGGSFGNSGSDPLGDAFSWLGNQFGF